LHSRKFVGLVVGAALAGNVLHALPATAEALLLIEADSGKVLQAENATYPWYPASVTKLMTAYVTLKAVKAGRINIDSPFVVSARALAQSPTKMGFKVGTIVTVDNALKMLMVKSANDMAVLLAEGVSGSVEQFAEEMNAAAARLGMTQTHYVNPNGLPDDAQVTSARDQAILARAIYRELPGYEYYWRLPGIKFGRRVIRNYNKLIDLYPGADGMKTGFICASGFNLVASATRNNRRLIAVVFGAPSSSVRAYKAAKLLEQGFTNKGLSWLMPALGTVEQLKPIEATPPNLREEMCGPKRKRPAAEDEEVEISANTAAENGDAPSPLAFMLSSLHGTVKTSQVLAGGAAPLPPVEVFVGAFRPTSAAAHQAQESQLVGGGKRKVAKGHKKSKTATAHAGKPSGKETAAGDKSSKPAATKGAPAAKVTPPKSASTKPAVKPTTAAAAKPAKAAAVAPAKPAPKQP